MLTDACSQVLQHMRGIQEEADRAREKRLLREKGGFRNDILPVNTNYEFLSKMNRKLSTLSISIIATHTHTLADGKSGFKVHSVSAVSLISEGAGITGCLLIQLKWTITLINLNTEEH